MDNKTIEDWIRSGVLRAESGNAERLLSHRKAHKISLGPHVPGQTPPPFCVDCGKPRADWLYLNEECTPTED
jgi:hypothetical protein